MPGQRSCGESPARRGRLSSRSVDVASGSSSAAASVSPTTSGIAEEGQPAGEERSDGDLVRGVVDARRGAALPPAARASASSGNVSVSGGENSQRERGQVERCERRRGALGVRERVRDRHAHVRIAEVRERGAVAEADERMDDRRRLDRDLDPVVGNAEEEVRLDHLEPLVRERRGVDRDLRAHAPGRMRERLLGRDVLELGARPAAERPAASR